MSDETKPSKAETVKSAEKATKTPREWALELGHGPKQSGPNQWIAEHGMSGVYGSVEYEVAKKLHGWELHEHHAGEPMQLTKADFEAALKATHPECEYEKDDKGAKKLDRFNNPIVKKYAGNPVPHPPAASDLPHVRERLAIPGAAK